MCSTDTAADRIGAIAAGAAGSLYLLRQLWRAPKGGRRAVAMVNRLGKALLGDPETGKLGRWTAPSRACRSSRAGRAR